MQCPNTVSERERVRKVAALARSEGVTLASSGWHTGSKADGRTDGRTPVPALRIGERRSERARTYIYTCSQWQLTYIVLVPSQTISPNVCCANRWHIISWCSWAVGRWVLHTIHIPWNRHTYKITCNVTIQMEAVHSHIIIHHTESHNEEAEKKRRNMILRTWNWKLVNAGCIWNKQCEFPRCYFYYYLY